MAFASLSVALESNQLISMSIKVMTTDGHLDWHVQLSDKLRPENTVSKMKLQKTIAKLSIKDKEDQMMLFEQMDAINNKFKTTT